MNLLHKTLNEQVLSPTFPGINFTRKSSITIRIFRVKWFKTCQESNSQQMGDLQLIKLEAQKRVLQRKQQNSWLEDTKYSLYTSGNAYS